MHMRDYRGCALLAATQLSSANATPGEIAEAAHAKCGGAYRECELAVYEVMTARGSSLGPPLAEKFMYDLRDDVRGQIIERVILLRSPATK